MNIILRTIFSKRKDDCLLALGLCLNLGALEPQSGMWLNLGEEAHSSLAEVLTLFYPLCSIFLSAGKELNKRVAFLLLSTTICNWAEWPCSSTCLALYSPSLQDSIFHPRVYVGASDSCPWPWERRGKVILTLSVCFCDPGRQMQRGGFILAHLYLRTSSTLPLAYYKIFALMLEGRQD